MFPTIVPPDLAAEIIAGDAITINEIARQFNVSPSTAFRWLMRGLPNASGERVRLQGLRRGKVWLSSRAALQRFLSALPVSSSAPTAPAIRSPSKRERDTARAKQSLNSKYGI
jgi:transposase-like protein